ncbi:nucleotide exchange factor GrpE [bacterium]|nr:nucleotide exchange factor GrpE [bacterium]UNM07225.1 MAG: nucleotide exchange factor GrpE [Planctomycetales bacterium]
MSKKEHGEQQEAQEPVVIDRRAHAAEDVDNTPHGEEASQEVLDEVMEQFSEKEQDPELVWAQKAAELQDMLLRREADLQNMRKRHVKDLDNARRNAVEALLSDLFPALDGLAQASAEFKDSPDGENSLLDGMRSTLRIIDNAFQRHGIVKISESGVPFDSELHQPLAVLDSAEVSEEMVGQVFVEGYRLGDTVLKPAMVQVLKPAE